MSSERHRQLTQGLCTGVPGVGEGEGGILILFVAVALAVSRHIHCWVCTQGRAVLCAAVDHLIVPSHLPHPGG